MKYLADTNVLSEICQLRPEPKVVQWLSANDSNIYVSVVSLGEIQRGIDLQSSASRRVALTAWFDRLVNSFEERILPVDLAIALQWGKYYARCQQAGRKPAIADSLLSATALVHDLTIATRNVKDFQGVDILNPFG